jgi:hypothetical protein
MSIGKSPVKVMPDGKSIKEVLDKTYH